MGMFLDPHGEHFVSLLQFCDYDVVARGYGGEGLRLDRTNEHELDHVVQQAQSEARGGKPVLINCLIGKTKFREGSISV